MQFAVISDTESFVAATEYWARQPQLWIDTEVAAWDTSTPRLSLLQVLDSSGCPSVVDVLAEPMNRVLLERFIPLVMANPSIEKWAHYARFDRAFLGGDRIHNFQCTFEAARTIPYYRLPLRSLSLKALVEHFFDDRVDKGNQTADWDVRPLPQALLAYAAADTEWCRRVASALAAIPRRPSEPLTDRPSEISRQYSGLLVPLKDAQAARRSIRDAVRAAMIGAHLARLSRFVLQTRGIQSTSLSALASFASAVDPGRRYDLPITIGRRLRDLLGFERERVVKAVCRIRRSQSLRGPRAPRSPSPAIQSYPLSTKDVESLTRDYERAEHAVLMLDSEREELRRRMQAWLEAMELSSWGDFALSEPRERWSTDVRTLLTAVGELPDTQIGFPQRLWLAFTEEDLATLMRRGVYTETPVLRWMPAAIASGPVAQESRDWTDIEEEDKES